ncbi:unnamed protein product [Acanthoscelides obtectus]|uniref:Uncharacterized protein n=1 Tax=Acanthoscelides obtectus TaxID=200917 RepID=A0A9P0JWL4_ACAOB|nr:unnamed protein product [Acanthoscelides obtectus]CAK1625499.1 hypothetical protein AOBTE_LOCUS3197 [Acanthoscelides obtectus]
MAKHNITGRKTIFRKRNTKDNEQNVAQNGNTVSRHPTVIFIIHGHRIQRDIKGFAKYR